MAGVEAKSRDAIGLDKEGTSEGNRRGEKSEMRMTQMKDTERPAACLLPSQIHEMKMEKNGENEDVRSRTVEFLMPGIGGGIRSVQVDKDRFFALGMKNYTDIVDVTQMSEATSRVLEQIMTGSRQFTTQVSMNQAAELIHVASSLKFVNLLKIMEKDLVGQTSRSMEQAVDSLVVAMHFNMNEAVEKLVDEIVFGYLNEDLLMYCKSSKALELIMKRRSSLMAEENQIPLTDGGSVDPWELLDFHPNESNSHSVAPHNSHNPENHVALVENPQHAQMGKVILNAAKQKFQLILSRPINSLKNGISWISAQHLRPRRRPQPARRDDDFEDFRQFPEFQNFHRRF